jgi:hypothetical protein
MESECVIQDGNITVSGRVNSSQRAVQPIPKRSSVKLIRRPNDEADSRQKIFMLGDSHLRGISAEIKHVLGNKAVVTGYVCPGARCATLQNIAVKEIKELSMRDNLVIWSGSNDIAKNEAENGLVDLFTLAQRYKNTNITIVNAPKRYDLIQTSCLNAEVGNFNRKLQELMEVYEHVQVVESVSLREHFTKHGQHLNKHGKEQMAHRLTNCIISHAVPIMDAAVPDTTEVLLPTHQLLVIASNVISMDDHTLNVSLGHHAPMMSSEGKEESGVPHCEIRSINDNTLQAEHIVRSVTECEKKSLLQLDVQHDEQPTSPPGFTQAVLTMSTTEAGELETTACTQQVREEASNEIPKCNSVSRMSVKDSDISVVPDFEASASMDSILQVESLTQSTTEREEKSTLQLDVQHDEQSASPPGDTQAVPAMSATGAGELVSTVPTQQVLEESSNEVLMCINMSRINIKNSDVSVVPDCEASAPMDSIPQVESLTQSVTKLISQPLLQLNAKQNELVLRKSARVKQPPSRKYRDFLY